MVDRMRGRDLMAGPRLSIIPAGAIFDRSLEPRDLHVLNLLGCYADTKSGWCRRSQVKMAKQLDCGRSSIQRSLERLVEAGWVQKKRPPWSNESGAPSHSYMYRVILDRDDDGILPDHDTETEADESHAEIASEETDCPPVGNDAEADGHPGAQPYVGTGAQPYVGTKNDPLERPLIERERDARAKDRSARFLVNFEKRWPTAAADDRQRTAYAAEALAEAEQSAALAGIGPFLENLKRLHRKTVPAGWRYLEEKRWTLLEQAKATVAAGGYAKDSPEAKAIAVLFEIAGVADFFRRVLRKGDGVVYYRLPVTPRLAALAQASPPEAWPALAHNQAAAWESFLATHVTVQNRNKLREGSHAPWPWPPSIEGKIYTETTGPPPLEPATDKDLQDFT
jgi:hypothetical protein